MSAVALCLLVLKTQHIQASPAFYGALGVDLVEEKHGNGPIHWAGRAGGVILEIYPIAEGDLPELTRLGFTVGDLSATLNRLAALGTTIDIPAKLTPWGTRAVVRDPDGRFVELYQREPVQ
jgi:catechol 2,3-dioxygenase-like lactoylglutathione lyase family enzyme